MYILTPTRIFSFPVPSLVPSPVPSPALPFSPSPSYISSCNSLPLVQHQIPEQDTDERRMKR